MAFKNWSKAKDTDKRDYFQEMTNEVIKGLEECEAGGWKTPWLVCREQPYNPVTGTKYSGVNFMATLVRKFPDPRFFTFKNVQELAEKTGLDLHVKKGEKGTPVFKALQVFTGNDREDGDAVEATDSNGVRSFWKMVHAGTVFNGSQIEGLEPYQAIQHSSAPSEEFGLLVEALRERTGLQLKHSEEGRAYYSPNSHLVHLPHPHRFKTIEDYIDTGTHELGHATGPVLGRDMSGKFGSEAYAKEEFVAELHSLFIGGAMGVDPSGERMEQHREYIRSWLKVLKEDKTFIVEASQKAGKAFEFNMGVLESYKLERDNKLSESQEHVESLMNKLRIKTVKPSGLVAGM